MIRRFVVIVSALVAGLMLLTAPASAGPSGADGAPRPGAPGAGDPYFPHAGNGGYDVRHYDLALSYTPKSKKLTGTATITATATQALSQFDLDLRALTVSALTVNGRAAIYERSGQELVVTPGRALRRGQIFTVVVRYGGVPKTVTDEDGALDGWIFTDDGAFVASEPQGAPSWYPVNDTPADKATYRVAMTVPKGLTAVGNGTPVGKRATQRATTFTWSENRPMASYLTTITLGRFDVHTSRTRTGIPVYVAIDPREAAAAKRALARVPGVVEWEQSVFGPYPFEAAGAIVDRAPNVGYALETQTKPLFDSAPGVGTLVHELAHQWYGDSVSLKTWQDIWLNEGFASYAEWLWNEHNGGDTAQQQFDDAYSSPASDTSTWNPPPGNPGSGAHIFDASVYGRGAMALQALRVKIGDKRFFGLLRAWAQRNRYGNATTADFVTLAERISGKDLHHFFQVWLYTKGKPTGW